MRSGDWLPMIGIGRDGWAITQASASPITNFVTKTGAGTLTLGGTTANTFLGGLNLNDGTLVAAKTAGIDATGAGNVFIGDGIGAAGQRLHAAQKHIADMGGVKVAFRAYKTLRASAAKTYVADGYTEDQQFFLSVGQVWCFKARDEWARMATQVDAHSPARFRVGGSLSNLPDFAEAFQCKPGSAMRRASACTIW